LLAIALDPNDQQLLRAIEEAAVICSHDNVDLACQYVERAAVDKSLRDVQTELAQEIEHRRRYQQSNGQVPWTMQLPNRYAQMLPEQLYPQSTGLKSQHLRVYEDFGAKPIEEAFSIQQTLEKVRVVMQRIFTECKQYSDKNITSLASISVESELVKQIITIP
jgi:Domain of unknown function (DUF3819)